MDSLDFTRAGSEPLLGGMMSVDNFGFHFPISSITNDSISFSALTIIPFRSYSDCSKEMATVQQITIDISGYIAYQQLEIFS